MREIEIGNSFWDKSLGEQLPYGFSVSVFGDVERPFFDFERCLWRYSHCGKDRRMQVTDRDRILDGDTWTFGGEVFP